MAIGKIAMDKEEVMYANEFYIEVSGVNDDTFGQLRGHINHWCQYS
jgi:hypothetical protein